MILHVYYYVLYQFKDGPLSFVPSPAGFSDPEYAIRKCHTLSKEPEYRGARLLAVGIEEEPSTWRKLRVVETIAGFEPRELLPSIGNDVDILIRARDSARARKDFLEADAIKKRILALGFIVEDNKDGTSSYRRIGPIV